jgi:hypothetical protein
LAAQILFRSGKRRVGKVQCCFKIVTIPAVIAEVSDEAYKVGKCAKHGRFLFFLNNPEIRLLRLSGIPTSHLKLKLQQTRD